MSFVLNAEQKTTEYDEKKHAMRHIIDVDHIPLDIVNSIYERASHYINTHSVSAEVKNLASKSLVAQLFFEHSTRTRAAFEVAAKRLGISVIHFNAAASSLAKGESWLDTAHNLVAMGCNLCVIRHSSAGMARYMAQHLPDSISVINAGDGSHAHPTQALLDVYTMTQIAPNFPNISVAIVGDIYHSRVAKSLITLLLRYRISKLRLIAPASLLPPTEYLMHENISVHTKLVPAINDVDFIIALRLQNERMQSACIATTQNYFSRYGLSNKTMQHAKKNATILHPGPINWGTELTSDVAPHLAALAQVKYGVGVRMAVFEHLLKNQKHS